MTTSSMGNSSLKMQIGIDVMKKAMAIESREVLSVLQSAAVPTSFSASNTSSVTPSVSSVDTSTLTGLGRQLDIKA